MKKVLVINDSDFERSILRDLLVNLGYEVKTSDEFIALGLNETYKPDIVVANMNMATITGDKILQKIKERKAQTKCYLSSCSELNAQYSNCRWVDGLIKTPISLGDLEKILND